MITLLFPVKQGKFGSYCTTVNVLSLDNSSWMPLNMISGQIIYTSNLQLYRTLRAYNFYLNISIFEFFKSKSVWWNRSSVDPKHLKAIMNKKLCNLRHFCPSLIVLELKILISLFVASELVFMSFPEAHLWQIYCFIKCYFIKLLKINLCQVLQENSLIMNIVTCD